MTKIIHGKIRGRTIQLTEDLGFTEGQEVEVSVRAVPIFHGLKNVGERDCPAHFAREPAAEQRGAREGDALLYPGRHLPVEGPRRFLNATETA